jgi:two-component system chemotaxis response regulator CheB
MPNKDVIVIGGSAGSGVALKQILADLPAGLPASIFITTHLSARSYLADMLAGAGPLPVSAAVDGQPIERSRIYVAVPDRHLLLADGAIRLGEGPRENMARPAIDPMFRSAALAYGPRAVGVVLSGMLNDGASGLSAIERCGGTALVQHPLDARESQMPQAALEAVATAAVAGAGELGALLAAAVAEQAGPAAEPGDSLRLEVEIAAGARLGAERLRAIADPSALNCPDCQGVLSEVRGEQPLRYRCQIGHAQTAEILVQKNDATNEAIRLAMRLMEERVTLVTRMARDARETGRGAVAELYEARAEEYQRYAATLRDAAILSIRTGNAGHEQDL